MTKFILHGGGMRTSADEGKAFFSEVVEGLGHEVKVLMCFFAQPEAVWQKKYAEWRVRMAVSVPKASIEFGLAALKDMQEQSEQYDVLFVYGGSSRMLIENFKEFGGYDEIIGRFKVVAGSSAGAIMLSKYAWDCDERKIVEGLGFVPAKILVHYNSKTYGTDDPRGPIDWPAAREELAEYESQSIPLFELAEGAFETFET
jgi:Peptidase family S51